jgi:renalase
MSKTKGLVIAVLGAAISGLGVYTRLRQAGIGAVLIDKSPGLGGRMAMRRVRHSLFDHGEQFFTARTAQFSALVEDLEANGLCAS